MQQRKRKTDQDGLYQRGDSPYWWGSFTNEGGQRTRRSTGTTDKKEAQEVLAKWRLDTRNIKMWGEKPDHTFDEMMLIYLKATQPFKRSAASDRHRTRTLLKVFSGRSVYSLGSVDRREYINTRLAQGRAGATINRDLSLASTAIKFVNNELDWDVVNFATGSHQKESSGRLRWITVDEASRLIEIAGLNTQSPCLKDFIRLALYTGMRTHEILYDEVEGREIGLEWDRVDLKANLIYLDAKHQKNGKAGSVPLNTVAQSALLSRRRFQLEHGIRSSWVFTDHHGNPIRSVFRSFKTAAARAGLDPLSPHDLRHTCCSWLVQRGVPLAKVQQAMRHANISTTMRYAHLSPQDSRAAIDVLVASRNSHVDEAREHISSIENHVTY